MGRPAAGAGPSPAGDRAPAIDLSLATALGGLADERAPVGCACGPARSLDRRTWSPRAKMS